MDIRAIQPSEVPAAYELLRECGRSHRLRSLAEFEQLLSASQRAVVAVEPDGRVIGFARAITDGLSNGYLSMVAVAPRCRGRGVGRALVAQATAGSPSVTWLVRAGRDGAAAFFARLGIGGGHGAPAPVTVSAPVLLSSAIRCKISHVEASYVATRIGETTRMKSRK